MEENMNQETVESFAATAQRLAVAAETLERVLGRMEAQQEEMGSKVDRIVAAVEETLAAQGGNAEPDSKELEARMADLEKVNTELKAQATRLARKTFSPMVTALLGKYQTDADMNSGVLDKTLSALSVEQRIAVKAEMARAGILK
jgi:ABC-type transporter Mla subunit MlaD